MANQPNFAAVTEGSTRQPGWIALLMLAVAGCQTVTTSADQPARLADTSDTNHKALQQAVNEMLGTEVAIADDALTNSSVLIIEQSSPRSIDGSPAQGRTMSAPMQFRLVLNGTACVLVDQRDESRFPLKTASCVAE